MPKLRLLYRPDYGAMVDPFVKEFRFPDLSHIEELVEEDARLLSPDGPETSAILLRNVIPDKLCERAFKSWYPKVTTQLSRTSITTKKPEPKSIGKNGRPSLYYGVPLETSKKLPGREENLGFNGNPLEKTTKTLEEPCMLDDNRELIDLVDSLERKYMRGPYERQLSQVKRLGCQLWDTAYSSMYLLKDWPSPYHTDDNNLEGVPTALICVGNFSGGELALPRWRVAFAFQPGDLILFNPQEVHGVLPFTGERVSAAFYCARSIAGDAG